MVAVALTKPISGPTFLWFRDKIGMVDVLKDSSEAVHSRGRVKESVSACPACATPCSQS